MPEEIERWSFQDWLEWKYNHPNVHTDRAWGFRTAAYNMVYRPLATVEIVERAQGYEFRWE